MKLIKNMAIVQEKRQIRVSFPQSVVKLFNDTFNWYVERKGDKIRLIGILKKKNYRLNYHNPIKNGKYNHNKI